MNPNPHHNEYPSEPAAGQDAYSHSLVSEPCRLSKKLTSESMANQNRFDDTSTQSFKNLDRDSLPRRGPTGSSRSADQSLHLPVPKRRNTNSALFRALEQPYESPNLLSNAPIDSSFGLQTNNDGKTCWLILVFIVDNIFP